MRVCSTGTGTLRSMIRSAKPPVTAMPSARGVTSSKTARLGRFSPALARFSGLDGGAPGHHLVGIEVVRAEADRSTFPLRRAPWARVWFPPHDHLVDLRRRRAARRRARPGRLGWCGHQPAMSGFENTARDVGSAGRGLACGTDGDVFEVAAGLGEIGNRWRLTCSDGNEQSAIAQLIAARSMPCSAVEQLGQNVSSELSIRRRPEGVPPVASTSNTSFSPAGW